VGGEPPRREQILDVLRRTKDRLLAAYEETRDTDFGARAEFRINWVTFLGLKQDPERHIESVMESVMPSGLIYSWSPETQRSELPRQALSASHTSDRDRSATGNHQEHAQTSTPPPHQPYWIVSTKTANKFHSAQVNRWLLYLEAVSQRVAESIRHKRKLAIGEQLDDGAMVKIVLQMLALSQSTVVPENQKGILPPQLYQEQI
jgi:hypothetical protein